MHPARAQGGADACAGIEAKKPAAVHGRTAIPESATQERTHEDRRGQDDDRSRRHRAGDHPEGTRIDRRGGHRKGEANQTRAAIRRDGTVFGEVEEPPSDGAGIPVSCGRVPRQDRTIPHPISRRWMDRGRSGRCGPVGTRAPGPAPRHPASRRIRRARTVPSARRGSSAPALRATLPCFYLIATETGRWPVSAHQSTLPDLTQKCA